jgi:xanthine dehydrogenase small subunit
MPAGMLLLDFIRYNQHLVGTKIGCYEGDCGACTVLAGEIKNDELHYRSLTSCLTPLGNTHGKHIVTIEGTNMENLNPVQQAMHDESATQCGFCTPGFVMSLTGFCLSHAIPTEQKAIASIDGNICRCTGYKSIERAAAKVSHLMQQRNGADPISYITSHNILPAWFADIKKRLNTLLLESNGYLQQAESLQIVGGGTDLYVQKHDEMKHASIRFLFNDGSLKGITKEGNRCMLGPSVTVTDISESPITQEYFPDLAKHISLVSSTPIRNIATIGGNFINASPIGDFTIFFLALGATVVLTDGINQRSVPLNKLYKGYKTLDKQAAEYIEKIWFELPDKNTRFNFEKVSKRTNLDIASVNSAISITIDGGIISAARISAGGVGPIPTMLEKTSAYIQGKKVSEQLIIESIIVAQTEISPISDARGTSDYKRLLLSQLIKAHFITLLPELKVESLLA